MPIRPAIYLWVIPGLLALLAVLAVHWKNSDLDEGRSSYNVGYVPVLAAIMLLLGPFSMILVAERIREFRRLREFVSRKQQSQPGRNGLTED